MRRIFALIALCLALPASPAFAADKAEETRININRLEQSIREQEGMLEEKAFQERSLLEELGRLDAALDDQRAKLEELLERQEEQRARIESKGRDLAALAEEHKDQQEHLMRRMRSYYLMGNTGLFNALFSSATVSELAGNNEAFRSLVTYDRELFRRFRESLAEINASKEELNREQMTLGGLIAQTEDQKRQMQEAVDEQQKFVEKVRAERALHQQAIREMNKAQRELEGTLNRMAEDEKQRGVKKFTAQKGKLSPPIEGPLVRGFMEAGTEAEEAAPFANGITIGVSGEREVRAVYGGVVIYADYMPGYGKMVIIEHADQYYTVTAKFAKIKVGEKTQVAQGDVLGTTDSFATLIGRGLYFEVRHGAVAEDPLTWLKRGSVEREAKPTGDTPEQLAEATLGASAALPESPASPPEEGAKTESLDDTEDAPEVAQPAPEAAPEKSDADKPAEPPSPASE